MPEKEFTRQNLLRKLSRIDADILRNIEMDTMVKNRVEEAINRVDGRQSKLKINNTWIDDPYDHKDYQKQLEIRNKGRTWAKQLRGDISLIDKSTGKEIDRVPNMKLADIPKYTPRRTYLIKGNEYQFTNQERLKPGIYTRIRDNGDISSFFNVDKTIDYERGFNNNFRLEFNPAKKAFTMGYGTKNIPLYNVMHALGVEDGRLKKAWGEEVLNANRDLYLKHEAKNLNKMYSAIYGAEPGEKMAEGEIKKAIKDRLYATKLDPKTTKITMGKSYKEVNELALLDAANRIVEINKGKAKPDEQDSMLFKSMHGPVDLVQENIIRNTGNVTKTVASKLDTTGQIRKSLSADTFNKYISGYLTTSQLSNPPGEVNAVSVLGNDSKLTVMGEGGIGSTNAASGEARNISSSQFGYLDPVHTPEGGLIGLTAHNTMGSMKIGSELVRTYYTRDGKIKMLSPTEVHDKIVAFPDQYDLSNPSKIRPRYSNVKAMEKGRAVKVSPSKVDLILPGSYAMFDTSTNTIPFLSSLQGNRALTASRMQEQALTLKKRDAPLFNVKTETGVPLQEALYSEIATERAPIGGIIQSVSDNEIIIKDDKGKKHSAHLYKNFPLNQEAFIHHEPVVKVGDRVRKNQLLADSNNTRGGRLAIGANIRTAYMPWYGLNFEDSAVITESGAGKLASEHLYDFKARRSSSGIFHRNKYKASFPDNIDGKQRSKLDRDGIIKVGQTVDPDDVLIAHMEKNVLSADDITLGRLDKSLRRDMRDEAVRWKHDMTGTVTGVEKHGNSVTVNVKTEEPLKVADKISGLHGNKAIVSRIIKDEEAPITPDRKRIDLIFNPAGVPGRINTSQTMEALAGRIAEKTGKPYSIVNFEPGDTSRNLLKDMRAAGIKSDKELLMNPETGKSFKNPVFHGTSHILKLEHKVDHKLSTRYRDGYDANMQPAKSGEEKAKSTGRMELNALLAHDAAENIQEMNRLKGQRNDPYWLAIETGQKPPPLQPTFAWDKQMAMMKGLGANVSMEGKKFALQPLTNKDITEMSSGEIKDPTKTYRLKDMAPERGGLFDPFITGGMSGNKWSHIQLVEPIPNPIANRAIPSIIGTTQKDYDSIINGDLYVNTKTQMIGKSATDGITGGKAIEILLGKVNPKAEIPGLMQQAKTAKGTNLNNLHKKIRYLKALENKGLKPTDYMIDKVPLIPPQYRPINQLKGGDIVISDVNELYRDIGLVNNQLKEMRGDPDIFKKELRRDLYGSVSASFGFGDPISYSARIKGLKGLMKQTGGSDTKQAKFGFFQNKVIRKNQDLVGRSTIIPNENLAADEIGIPREMGEKIFQPFVMKQLTTTGYTPLQAQKMIKERSPQAKRALDIVANERLVLANRAPSLHRYSMMAFEPKIVEGKAIQIPHLIVGGFNADFDGDTFQIHTPVGRKALEEAERMKPSSNVLKFGHKEFLPTPTKEAVVGAWLTSKGKNDTGMKFGNVKGVENAVSSGTIDYADIVGVGPIKAPAGMHVINSVLPEQDRQYNIELNKKNIRNLLSSTNEKYGGKKATDLADTIKRVGNTQSTLHGWTLGVSDTLSMKDIRDAELKKADAMVRGSKNIDKITKAYVGTADRNIKNELIKQMRRENNPLAIEIDSGAGKGIGNVSQIKATPMLLRDPSNNIIPIPVRNSYSEGVDISDYMTTAYGVRKGAVDKNVQTFKPGWITNDLTPTVYSTIVRGGDGGDRDGIEFSVNDRDGMDRMLARPVYNEKGTMLADRNEAVNDKLVNKLKIAGIKSYRAQSPLTDPTPGNAIAANSFGIDYSGQKLRQGSNIGVQSAQTITEPSTQLIMRTFHTGGTVSQGGGVTNAFDRLEQLLRLPKNIHGTATFAGNDGKVDMVKKSPVGGWDVSIGSKRHYVEAANDPTIKTGQEIKKGDVISTGLLNPHELLEHKGIKPTQKYLTDELVKLHRDNGQNVDRRPIEVIVRSMTNATRIKDPGGFDFVPGDPANLTTVEDLNKNHREIEIGPADSIGNRLANAYGPHKKGTRIDRPVAEGLRAAGFSKIKSNRDPIKHDPFLSGVTYNIKETSTDWLTRMAQTRLKDTVMEGATQAWTSDILGDSPIPSLVYGNIAEKGKK